MNAVTVWDEQVVVDSDASDVDSVAVGQVHGPARGIKQHNVAQEDIFAVGKQDQTLGTIPGEDGTICASKA